MAAPLPSYSDCGDCQYVCQYCLAYFWAGERLLSGSAFPPFKYSHCCRNGTVVFPFPLQPPPLFLHLFSVPSFMEKIRAYNSLFAMTSFGAEVDDTINSGRGPYVFKVSGQISHWLGSMCPVEGERPRFLQLYVYDTANEVSNRLSAFAGGASGISSEYVRLLSETLTSCNEYVRLFKTAAELSAASAFPDFAVRLYNDLSDRRYSLPAEGTLGGIVRESDAAATSFDIIVRYKDGTPQRVSKLHASYMPLQYPLLFPYAEQGWSAKLKLRSSGGGRDRNLTTNMYYSYHIHDRHQIYSLLLRGGRLFQQYLVDAYMCIEQGRLDYIKANQNSLRSEYASGVYVAVSNGDTDPNQIGKRVFLPSSFTGGPRYMYKHYQDALAICRVHGNPQYFITFTCNARWPEITRHLERFDFRQAQDRPDIIARIFQIKVIEMLKYLRTEAVFGTVVADLYTIEFQKRGLPHCHALLWVAAPFRIVEPSDVDAYITAELPDRVSEPDLYRTISESMLHGPCGLPNPTASCMHDFKCTKKFPKDFSNNTWFDDSGYIHYRSVRFMSFMERVPL